MLELALGVTRGAFRLDARIEAPTPGVIALFGRSGCGKTTLVNAIAGLGPRPAGHLRLDGETLLDDAQRICVPAERRRIGYVFQDARLFPHLDVLANLRYGARRTRGAQPFAAFDDVVALLGLAPLLARRTPSLSGGERQRVALGRALLCQPRLLLLDEPLASLDDARRAEVLPYLELLRDRWRIPIVYVSHRYDEVLRLATHVVVMGDGRVLASGTAAQTSLAPALQSIVGPDAAGAVLEATVTGCDGATGLATLALGSQQLRLAWPDARAGARVRVHVPARDVILALDPPRGLSIRNALRARIATLDDAGADEVTIALDVDGERLLARVTRAACAELALSPGRVVWALVKAASLQGHAFPQPEPPAAR